MEKNKKFLVSLIFNAIIVLSEIVALVIDLILGTSAMLPNIPRIAYYTFQSNIFLLVCSTLFLIFGIKAYKTNSQRPLWTSILRFFSTCYVTVTFLVVVFVLIPLKPSWTLFLLFGNSLFVFHTFAPILSFVSFAFFERDERITKKYIFYSIIPTMSYGFVMTILNIANVITGPYVFLEVYNNPVYLTIIVIIGFALFSILLATLLRWLNQCKKRQKT